MHPASGHRPVASVEGAPARPRGQARSVSRSHDRCRLGSAGTATMHHRPRGGLLPVWRLRAGVDVGVVMVDALGNVSTLWSATQSLTLYLWPLLSAAISIVAEHPTAAQFFLIFLGLLWIALGARATPATATVDRRRASGPTEPSPRDDGIGPHVPALDTERLRALLHEIQWGDRERDPDGTCPSCARSEMGHGGRHALGCSVRAALELLEDEA